MRTISFIYLVFICHLVFAQELKELRHTSTSDFRMDFYITFSQKKVRYEDTLHYYWFKSQKIHITQGSSEGNLLHGPFNKFYYSGQLAEQGEFEKGLKTGEWKSWYESGNLMAIYNFNDGLLSGSYALYNENGDVRETGKIRNGKWKTDEEKISRRETRKKVKEAMSPDSIDSEEEKKGDKKDQREDKKLERQKRRSEEGNFIERLFHIRFKEKDKKSGKKDKKPKEKVEKPKTDKDKKKKE